MAVKKKVTLVREGRKRLLRVLARHDANLAEDLEPLGEPDRSADYADQEQLLTAEVRKGRELISRLEDRKEEGVVELRQVVQFQGVASFSDPYVRWGFKKRDEPFLGYKAQAVCDKTRIAIAVTVTPRIEAELPQFPLLLEELKDGGIRPLNLAADKGHADADMRRELAEAGIWAYITPRHDLGRLEIASGRL